MRHLRDIATGLFKHLMNAFFVFVTCVAIGICVMAIFLEVMIYLTNP